MSTYTYVGIETEYELYQGQDGVNFADLWRGLAKKYQKPHFKFSDTCYRTMQGSSFYCDQQEPEAVSAPVLVSRGFASKAVDALYLARKELVDFISSDLALNLIGYSMHYNIGATSNTPQEVMRRFAVPYSLFVLNHLSCGINLRLKGNSHGLTDRYELLGDYMEDKHQIKSFLLFYAATILNEKQCSRSYPLSLSQEYGTGPKYNNLVPDGRYSMITVTILQSNRWIEKKISAQTYLQYTYEWMKPAINQLGTRSERKTLEDFVYGRRPLEIDKFKKYTFISTIKDGKSINYHPDVVVDSKDYQEEKILPTPLHQLLRDVVDGTISQQVIPTKPAKHSNYAYKTIGMQWDYLAVLSLLNLNSPSSYEIHGLTNLDLTARVLAKFPPAERRNHFRDLANMATNLGDLSTVPLSADWCQAYPKLVQALKKAITTANAASPCANLTEIPLERIDELENMLEAYDPNKDDSFLLDEITVPSRNFSWRSVLHQYQHGSSWQHRAEVLGYSLLVGSILTAAIFFLTAISSKSPNLQEISPTRQAKIEEKLAEIQQSAIHIFTGGSP